MLGKGLLIEVSGVVVSLPVGVVVGGVEVSLWVGSVVVGGGEVVVGGVVVFVGGRPKPFKTKALSIKGGV